MAPIFLTEKKLEELKERLRYLKADKTAEIAERISVAISYGDLSENAEYKTAKEDKNELEAEIAKLEDQISNAQIIKKTAKASNIIIGSVVKVFDDVYKEEITYTISGILESNPAKNIISNESPVGKALMGHVKGDKVVVYTPNGELKFKILDVVNK